LDYVVGGDLRREEVRAIDEIFWPLPCDFIIFDLDSLADEIWIVPFLFTPLIFFDQLCLIISAPLQLLQYKPIPSFLFFLDCLEIIIFGEVFRLFMFRTPERHNSIQFGHGFLFHINRRHGFLFDELFSPAAEETHLDPNKKYIYR
jgi:hypothetical protein